jgi:hypothetical protein
MRAGTETAVQKRQITQYRAKFCLQKSNLRSDNLLARRFSKSLEAQAQKESFDSEHKLTPFQLRSDHEQLGLLTKKAPLLGGAFHH